MYICVLVSIGLLVDFMIHMLLHYYQSPASTRDAKVADTLETMGVSILLGGLTTLLAVVPLCLSTAEVFMTVFYAFFAMVGLGISHGLILLPVILSLIGPVDRVTIHQYDQETVIIDKGTTQERHTEQTDTTGKTVGVHLTQQSTASTHGHHTDDSLNPEVDLEEDVYSHLQVDAFEKTVELQMSMSDEEDLDDDKSVDGSSRKASSMDDPNWKFWMGPLPNTNAD